MSDECSGRRLKGRAWWPVPVLLLLALGTVAAQPEGVVVDDAAVDAARTPTVIEFPLRRTGSTQSQQLHVDYQTVDGSARAGIDYEATSGTRSLAPGRVILPLSVGVAAHNGPPQPDLSFELAIDSITASGPLPTYAVPVPVSANSGLDEATTADLDGDGRPDLILSRRSATVDVRLNRTQPGSSTVVFAAAQNFAAGRSVDHTTTADFNGDGLIDVAASSRNFDVATVLLNRTAPGSESVSFGTPVSVAVGDSPERIAAGDLNGDGRPDLVVTLRGRGGLRVLFNRTEPGAETPSFTPSQQLASAVRDGGPLALADFNLDGRLDVAAASLEPKQVWYWLNDIQPGSLSATTQSVFGSVVATAPRRLVIADLNGDGRPDVATAGVERGVLSVVINRTQPGAALADFETPMPLGARPPTGLVAGDFDGDGRTDLATVDAQTREVAVRLNITTGSSQAARFATSAPIRWPSGTVPERLLLADWNLDGRDDLLILRSDAFATLLNNAPAPVSAPLAELFPATLTPAAPDGPNALVAADFNGDGRRDLALSAFDANAVGLLLNQSAPGGEPAFGAPTTLPVSTRPRSVVSTDLNGDGRPDLITANQGTDTVATLLNTTPAGSATASFSAARGFLAGSQPFALALIQADNDGRPDVVVANSGDGTVSILLNRTEPGAAVATLGVQQVLAAGATPRALAAGDLDADGLEDLVVVNFNSDTVSVLRNARVPVPGSVIFSEPLPLASGARPQAVALGDVDGDGRPDIVVGNFTAGTVSVLLNRSVPGTQPLSFLPRQAFAAGAGANGLALVDVDRDGRVDVVAANRTANTLAVLRNTTQPGTGQVLLSAPETLPTGAQPYAVITADLDGDGLPDLASADNGADATTVFLDRRYAAGPLPPPATGTIRRPDTTDDLTPDAYTFTDLDSVTPDSVVLSNEITVSGLTVAAPIVIEGHASGFYQVNGGAFTQVAGSVANGDRVRLRLRSVPDSTASGQTRVLTLNIGDGSDAWAVRIADQRPAPFSFTDLTDVAAGTAQASAAIIVRGISAPTPISVSGDPGAFYQVNNQPFTNQPGLVNEGDRVRARVRAAPVPSTVTQAVVRIGALEDSFSVSTVP